MIFSLFLGGGVYSRGSVYFKIRDFRGAFIRGGVYSRRDVYSRKYGIWYGGSLALQASVNYLVAMVTQLP